MASRQAGASVDGSLADKIGLAARNAMPGIIIVVLVFVSLSPLNIPYAALLMPPLSLMAVYYWSIYRPDLLPAPAVFVIGLFHDILSGGPLGMFALVFVLVHAIVSAQRRFFLGKVFFIEWAGFALVVLGSFIVIWVLGSLYIGAIVNVPPLAIQALLTITLYPVLTWFLILFRRGVARI